MRRSTRWRPRWGGPLIAAQMVQIARQEGAKAIAHGCTGKGNDQVRFDVSTAALAPDLLVVAPVREWGMNRDDEIEYAREHGIPVPATAESPYSTDENLWGRSIEAGILEDPWAEPPPEVFEWTRDPRECPEEPAYVEVSFKEGLPTAIDGRPLDALEIVTRLNQLGGETGVGRIDHLENRLIGIKSREIYEAPAAVLLLQAHQALEDITLPKDVARFKDVVAQQWGQMVYDGLWFSPLRDALYAFVAETQRHVTGDVRLKLYRGSSQVVGQEGPGAALPAVAGHLRQGRHLRPVGGGGLHQALGPGRPDRVAGPGPAPHPRPGRPPRRGQEAGSLSKGKMWGGRFRKPLLPELERFSSSLEVDLELAPYDVAGSIAHARGLLEAGLLTKAGFNRLHRALVQVGKEIESGQIRLRRQRRGHPHRGRAPARRDRP